MSDTTRKSGSSPRGSVKSDSLDLCETDSSTSDTNKHSPDTSCNDQSDFDTNYNTIRPKMRKPPRKSKEEKVVTKTETSCQTDTAVVSQTTQGSKNHQVQQGCSNVQVTPPNSKPSAMTSKTFNDMLPTSSSQGSCLEYDENHSIVLTGIPPKSASSNMISVPNSTIMFEEVDEQTDIFNNVNGIRGDANSATQLTSVPSSGSSFGAIAAEEPRWTPFQDRTYIRGLRTDLQNVEPSTSNQSDILDNLVQCGHVDQEDEDDDRYLNPTQGTSAFQDRTNIRTNIPAENGEPSKPKKTAKKTKVVSSTFLSSGPATKKNRVNLGWHEVAQFDRWSEFEQSDLFREIRYFTLDFD